MKYKIKVEVMQDGKSRYYPMVKKHWWSRWEYIDGHITYNDITSVFSLRNKETAQDAILEYIQYKMKVTRDHVYEIPYKEEEL